MKSLQLILWRLSSVLLICITASARAEESAYNMTQGVTNISEQVYDLHMLIFYICCAIAVVVFGAMFYSMYHHRKSKGAVAAHFHESTKVEVIWTVIPIIILVLMAIPATKTLVAMEDTSQSDLTIKITGSQWKWHYSYFGEDVEFFSLLATSQKAIDGIEEKGAHYLLEVDNPLVLPINRKVRFLMTADDVIHSWWVPAFAVKKDTIPGFINEAWTRIDKPGVYRGQCAELCGRAHGFMPIVVHAMEEEKYDEWLLAKKAELEKAKQEAAASLTASLSMDELMSVGEKVYLDRCAVCHQANGAGIPGAFPAITGSKVATGDVSSHIDIVVNGRSGTAMQAFSNQLTDKEIAAVVTYQRNGLGNSVGDLVQASDVNQLKASKEGQ
ncbi:cytochrome c oxidase subunit II [Vibrio europaeus]|uniref:Cytochrome c oxidase subunit 2 n=1 Tax=Vibrio europaeus TaxID=300876 RepID=A0A178J6R0_9VIBR|nr:cytochrome c oxidase subunit II [Vibrio europaeus]MDC5705959.1 cytochrome c oxidase subunit II [Vibrio europaeus]MDC5709369.1 cytochrome c oxidase subunit II [Vibrio europaeus]MDC5713768.1 cytochrome c oxidase subunit II [Vibrio europaeus]MDC5720488.1 cytochrome c oxidase subunit II [Vibrio europaeus]MDC5723625.1 cytochrome c oxidase subunit II [Vibrio europaeus]